MDLITIINNPSTRRIITLDISELENLIKSTQYVIRKNEHAALIAQKAASSANIAVISAYKEIKLAKVFKRIAHISNQVIIFSTNLVSTMEILEIKLLAEKHTRLIEYLYKIINNNIIKPIPSLNIDSNLTLQEEGCILNTNRSIVSYDTNSEITNNSYPSHYKVNNNMHKKNKWRNKSCKIYGNVQLLTPNKRRSIVNFIKKKINWIYNQEPTSNYNEEE